jgi:hypothetical protein
MLCAGSPQQPGMAASIPSGQSCCSLHRVSAECEKACSVCSNLVLQAQARSVRGISFHKCSRAQRIENIPMLGSILKKTSEWNTCQCVHMCTRFVQIAYTHSSCARSLHTYMTSPADSGTHTTKDSPIQALIHLLLPHA